MNWIRLVIHQPVLIMMIEAFLVVMGLMGLGKLGIDLYPEVDPPIITVSTTYPGAGPEEIETLISKPIEEQVNQLGAIEKIQSTSREGLSQVVIEFQLEKNAQEAKFDVRDKISQIRSLLPDDIEEPIVERLDFSDTPIVKLALQTESKNPSETELLSLRQTADQKVKNLFEQIDGVGSVKLFGGLVREIQVQLDFGRMRLWKTTPVEVSAALARSNKNTPAGRIKENPASRSIRLVGEYHTVFDIGNTLIKTLPGGKSVFVRDVAQVADRYEEPDSLARVDGKSVVLLEIKRQSGQNIVAVANKVIALLPSVQERLPTGMTIRAVQDGARKIRMSIEDVMETLVIAAILTVVVVFLFLGSWESTLITGFALPATLIASFYFLYLGGYTLNVMTLLGLTLAVGLLLDDAIVVRENVWSKISEGMPAAKAAEEGTREVFIAVIATSLTILAVFLPVTLIPGIVGRFFAAFAITVCIAIVLSTFDALTVAPMLSAYLIRSQHSHHMPRFVERIHSWFHPLLTKYERLLGKCLDHPVKTLLISAGIFLGSLFLIPLIGFTFSPTDESGEVDVSFEAPAGATLDHTSDMALHIEQVLSSFPEVDYYATRVGSDLGEENTAVTYVRLREDSKRVRTSVFKQKLQAQLKPFAQRENLTLSIHSAGGRGGGKPITLSIRGDDNSKLLDISNAAVSELQKSVPGAVNITPSLRAGRSEIQLSIDRNRASQFGLQPAEVGNVLRGWFEGIVASKYRENGEEYDIRVQLDPSHRTSTEALEFGEVYGPSSEPVPLKAVVRKQNGVAPTKIIRVNQQRAAVLEGDLADGAALASVLKQISQTVDKILPPGYHITFDGQAKSLKDLQKGMVVALGLGVTFIYMIMAALYGSYLLPFAILLTMPLAVCGALGALLIAGRFMDIYAVIGIILLMGVVTKNAILLVDYIEHVRAKGVDRIQALKDAGLRRFRPIMMTTIATVAGMVPIALGFGELNAVRAGMGIAAIGGLISSTLLSLIVVPCAYIYLDDFRLWSRSKIKSLGYAVKQGEEIYAR